MPTLPSRHSPLRSCGGLLLAILASVCLLAASPLAAQAPAGRGSISGSVLGPDGARLPGVSVTLIASASAVARVVTGDHGGYRVSALPAGEYEVRAELDGFRPATAFVVVRPATVTQLELTLTLATLQESIDVVGIAPKASLEAAKLGESGARDVGEALGGMAGVWKVRRGAIASDVVVRGYQGENLTVLIDGVRLHGACPNNMDPTVFHVDFAEVERVEIGKGPFDLRNQGALGGVVNIVTKRPGRGFHANPQVTFGSAGYLNPSTTVSFGADRFAVLGGYSYRRSDGYRDGSGRSFLSGANYRSSATDLRAFDVNTGWGRLDFAPSQSDRILVTLARQRAGTVLYPYLQMDALWDKAWRIKAGWDSSRPIGPLEALRAEAYATGVRHWMTDQYRTSSASISMPAARSYSMATMARTDSTGIRGEAVLANATVGVDAYHRRWVSEAQLAMSGYQPQYSIPDVGLTSIGVFGEYSRELDDGLRLDVGGRIDRTAAAADGAKANAALYLAYHGTAATSARDVYPTGKLRLSWLVRPSMTVSGGLGRTARVADPQERYFGLQRTGTDWVGNPSLGPTSNTSVDVSFTARRPRLYVNATVHRDSLDDFIAVYQQGRVAMVPGVMNLAARTYRNVGATMSGAEAEGVVSVTDRLFVSADVSTVRGRQHADAARGIAAGSLAEIPPVRSRVAARYDLRRERYGVFAEIEGIYSARQARVAIDLREMATPAFAVANLRLGATTRAFRLTLGVGNILDRTYLEHLSYQRDPFRSGVTVFEPGRNVYSTVSIRF